MSKYYSSYLLNTFYGTPYFQAQLPRDYPLDEVLRKCRAFRRLPPNLQKLSRLSRQWQEHQLSLPFGTDLTDGFYDSTGYELDPDTGHRLTDAEIDAQWRGIPLPTVTITDIPKPPGGFPDPDIWMPEEPPEPEADDEDGPTRERLLESIADRGAEYVSKEYGIPIDQLPTAEIQEDIATGEDYR